MFKVGEKVYLASGVEPFESFKSFPRGTKATIKEVKSDELILKIGNDEVIVKDDNVLKTCRCGGEPNLIVEPDEYAEVYCYTCKRNVKVHASAYFAAIDRAIVMWNKRA